MLPHEGATRAADAKQASIEITARSGIAARAHSSIGRPTYYHLSFELYAVVRSTTHATPEAVPQSEAQDPGASSLPSACSDGRMPPTWAAKQASIEITARSGIAARAHLDRSLVQVLRSSAGRL